MTLVDDDLLDLDERPLPAPIFDWHHSVDRQLSRWKEDYRAEGSSLASPPANRRAELAAFVAEHRADLEHLAADRGMNGGYSAASHRARAVLGLQRQRSVSQEVLPAKLVGMTWDNKPISQLESLNEEQAAIFEKIKLDVANKKKLIKIDGPAGTGKTLLLATVARWLMTQKGELCLCAKTGKASGNMADKTGIPASTVDGAARKFLRVVRIGGRLQPEFETNLDFRPHYLIIDEASMISRNLGNELVSRCSGTVFAFGDRGQLDPIPDPLHEDPGEAWFLEPDYELSLIMRQSPNSTLVKQARRIRDIGMYISSGDGFEWAFKETPELLASADAILCFNNVDRLDFARKKRAQLGYSETMLYPGEPLMCWRNDRYKSIYNGTVVHVRDVWTEGAPLKLIDHRKIDMRVGIKNPLIEGFNCKTFDEFRRRKDEQDGNNKKIWTPFTLGYSCTVHKAQGSEWDTVLVVLRGDVNSETPKLLYTAVTRARMRVIILHLDNAFDRLVEAPYAPEELEAYDNRH
jgi:exodeoxyribonuclease-5